MMNKKHKLKRIKWGALITVSCLIGVILLNTSAKSLSNSKAKVKKLAEEKNKCEVLYNTDFFNGNQQNGEGIVMTQDENDSSKITVSVKTKNNKKSNSANFWIFVAAQYESTDTNGNIKSLGEDVFNKSFNKTYTVSDTPTIEVFAVVVYKDGVENACGEIDQNTARNIANDYFKNKSLENNRDLIGQKNYVVRAAGNVFEESNNEVIYESGITDDDKAEDEDLKSAIEKANEEKSETSKATDYDRVTGEKGNPKGSNEIKCDKSTLYKEGQQYYTPANSKTYYYEKTETTEACEKTCKEEVTVEYGPPVATKAGMCFEYKVKVRSKVACSATFKAKKPKSTDSKYQVCAIYPKCNANSKYGDQAGPDEDFDNCISKCDNGKYSQKCINKCYKEVYGNTDIQKTAYNDIYENNSVSFLAAKKDLSGNGLKTNASFCLGSNDPTTYVDSDGKTNYSKLKYAMLNNGCKYQMYNNKTKTKWNGSDNIIWSCANSNLGKNSIAKWNNLGRYYFLNNNIATRTIQSIATDCQGEDRYFDGVKYQYKYFIDGNGFKRAKFNNGTTCTQSCTWKISGNKNCYLNRSDMLKQYKDDLNAWTDARNSCTASASCSNETATFTIGINNDTTDGTIKSKFSSTLKNENGVVIRGVTDKIDPIVKTNYCYLQGSTEKQQYLAEWSFPGSWRNNKNGVISQTEPSDTRGWSQRKGYYCTSLNSTGVNSKWWNWAQYTKLKNSVSKYTSNDITYNINAITNNFGYFGWNIDMSCFYATPSATTPPTAEECTGEENCDTNTDNSKFEYEARSVEKDKLFPESRTKVDAITGKVTRTIGYNWTAQANENLITGAGKNSYEIMPEELIEDIQDKAKNGTTYSPENLEYRFRLNRSNLNALKNAKSNLTDFPTNVKTKSRFDGYEVGSNKKTYTIYAYHSGIIRNRPTYVSEFEIKRQTFCNNWDNGSCKTY